MRALEIVRRGAAAGGKLVHARDAHTSALARADVALQRFRAGELAPRELLRALRDEAQMRVALLVAERAVLHAIRTLNAKRGAA